MFFVNLPVRLSVVPSEVGPCDSITAVKIESIKLGLYMDDHNGYYANHKDFFWNRIMIVMLVKNMACACSPSVYTSEGRVPDSDPDVAGSNPIRGVGGFECHQMRFSHDLHIP